MTWLYKLLVPDRSLTWWRAVPPMYHLRAIGQRTIRPLTIR